MRDGADHILFVDDEPTVLDGIRRILRPESWRWRLHFAGTVDEAVRTASCERVDTVVSDVNMPERDGFDLLRAFRDTPGLRDIPVIMLTGNGELDLKRRALDLGAMDLLNKPIGSEDLCARLSSVLRVRACEVRLRTQNELLEQRVRERTAELELSHNDVVWRLARAGEFRDEETGAHVERVAHFTREIALALGLSEAEAEALHLASPLHDIGKIGIPDSILRKPGRLTPEEWDVMRSHCRIGWEILRENTGVGAVRNTRLALAAEIALGHHERWDGTGYPGGLRGEAIPIPARIVAAADVLDALCSERPYKRAMPFEESIEEIRRSSGSHFDPRVVGAVNACVDALRHILESIRDEEQGPGQGREAA